MNNFIHETKKNTYKFWQEKNGMYRAERISIFNDNDISAITTSTMNEVWKWVDSQEDIS